MPLSDYGLDFASYPQEPLGIPNDPFAFPPIPAGFENFPNAAEPQIQLPNSTPTPVLASASRTHLPDISNDVLFRVETKRVFICAYHHCNKEFGRKPELYRHHRSAHRKERPFKCREASCERSVRGFPRRDKRDDHVKSMHRV